MEVKCESEMKIKHLNISRTSIPNPAPDPQEIAKQIRINCDIVKKEISDHVDAEIARFKKEIGEIR